MFSCNPVFVPVLKIGPEIRYVDLWGGRARGGSYFATEMALALLSQPEYFRGYFMRLTYKDIRESLWQDFRDRYDEKVDSGEIDERDYYISDARMTATHLKTGNTIQPKGFRKSDKGRTAKLKSIAGATHVFIEECEEIEETDFMQLDDSLRTKKSNIRIFRIFNPPKKNHWLMRGWYNLTESKQKGYYVAKPKSIPGFLSIFSTYHYNLSNLNPTTVRNFESYRIKQPEYYWTTIRGLVSEGAKGRIFSNWQPITAKGYDLLPYPAYYGIDFGFSNDPTALVKIKEHNGRVWVKPLLYETDLTDDELAKRMKQLGVKGEIFADSAEPKTIETLKRKGFNIRGVGKGPDSIRFGVKTVKSKQISYVEDDEHFAYEYQEYRYALGENKLPTDEPADNQVDHYMDAFRYGINGRSGRVVGKAKARSPKIRNSTDI